MRNIVVPASEQSTDIFKDFFRCYLECLLKVSAGCSPCNIYVLSNICLRSENCIMQCPFHLLIDTCVLNIIKDCFLKFYEKVVINVFTYYFKSENFFISFLLTLQG